MKKVNLKLLIRNINDKSLYQKYISVLCDNDDYKIKPRELKDLSMLIKFLNLETIFFESFYFSYSIPQIGKEFDLLKYDEENVLNIELKSKYDEDKIISQIIRNNYYLSFLPQKNKYIFTYCSENNKIYYYFNSILQEINVDDVKEILMNIQNDFNMEINDLFIPSKYMVSPLNNCDRFINDNYFLNINQERIKNELLKQCLEGAYNIIVRGKAGTGKTLVLYDLAKELSQYKKVLVIHSGLLCEGHLKLKNKIENFSIIPIKEVKNFNFDEYEIIMVDEAHRLRENSLKFIIKHILKNECSLVLFGDNNQKLTLTEEKRSIQEILEKNGISINSSYELTTKVRINRKLSNFIKVLFDKNKVITEKFDNVKILYCEDYDEFIKMKEYYCLRGYKYICYTPSVYKYSILDKLNDEKSSAHEVIGQEFEKVILYLDENFYYDKSKRLKSKVHPCKDYIYTKLLFQAITRVRNDLIIVVINNIELLNEILKIFEKSN